MSSSQRGPGVNEPTTEQNLEYAASLILKVFQSYDVDKGGTLQRRELRTFLRQCGAKLTDKQCDGIIDQLDTDGDGELNFAEFMSFLGRIYQLQFFGTDAGLFWKRRPQPRTNSHSGNTVSHEGHSSPSCAGFNERPLPKVPKDVPPRSAPSKPPPTPPRESAPVRRNLNRY